ncbi:MAG: hypothetical protein M1820_004362 [Bogoriella megaspora]|nr:MAG: hypothetical protein M1820_004362 [Bogoriella megaspora]
MRRQSRSGGPVFANRPPISPVPDPLSLIRAFDSDSNSTRPLRSSPLTASTIQGIPLELLDRLRSFPLFQSAPDTFLAAIAQHLRFQLHQGHDYILTEGDDAKAMYWLVRGGVRVTSRDGESTFAELKPGAFFGEIGVLMDMPRTATIVAKMKSLVVRLNKEDLQKVLPNFPDIEHAIRDEAKERLAILERKKKESGYRPATGTTKAGQTSTKRPRDRMAGDVEMGDAGILRDGEIISNKRRKSPSPGLAEAAASSAFGSGPRTVRQILKELPLFSDLPASLLHFLGLNVQPRTYPPFTDIIEQESHGRDVYFIVSGEVEVVADRSLADGNPMSPKGPEGTPGRRNQRVVARLKAGQYFGEVTSLSLAPRRTATVRSVASVECLMISGDVLTELWERFPPSVRREVELEARSRMKASDDFDVDMADAFDGTPAINQLEIGDTGSRTPKRPPPPTVTLSESKIEAIKGKEEAPPVMEPYDPDPFLNAELDNIRSRSRRSSIAPPTTTTDGQQTPGAEQQTTVPGSTMAMPSSPLKPRVKQPTGHAMGKLAKRPKTAPTRPSHFTKGTLPDTVLVHCFQYLDLLDLMRLRLVSSHWQKLLTTSPHLLHYLDLSQYNRFVTDSTLATAICPFIGQRPRIVDISNCFHVTDEGFNILASTCGASVRSWKMKSVWDITGQAVLELINRARDLQEIDLSNCRKVGDNLLARVVGWVVPEMPPQHHNNHQSHHQVNGVHRRNSGARSSSSYHNQQQQQPPLIPPGTVVGCPKLTKITLSYCKHITDRSMAHLAVHAAARLEEIDLTRCTTITDQGFQHWSVYAFPRLHRLCLADCTYLSDQAIISLTNAARGLRELDLSFCCALSDTATEVLSLGCPSLTHLNLAFCGSAVSDGALRCIGLHLLELRELSVRGCVRVTGVGVEAVIDGCNDLQAFDVSQCKNLTRWLEAGGVQRKGRGIRFETVADGRWRVHK